MNTNVEMNVISQNFTIEHDLIFILNVTFSHFIWMNEKSVYYYEVYSILIRLRNNWNINKESVHVFYTIDKEKSSLILNMSELKNNNVHINIITKTWRFDVKKNLFKLVNVINFAKIINDEFIIYVFIVINIFEDETKFNFKKIKTEFIALLKKTVTSVVLNFLKEYENVFSSEKVNKLS